MLTETQLDDYRRDGYVMLPDALPSGLVERIHDEVQRLYACDVPGRMLEKDGTTVRGIHGCHRVSDLLSRLVRLPALLEPAEQVLAGKVYVHQSKVNAKRGVYGDAWPWHQDFIFWQREDGIAEPRLTNVALFLDDATASNGPLLLLAGSHRSGTLPAARRTAAGWQSNLSADLDYALDAEQLRAMARRYPVHAATGTAGSLMLFDPRLVHGSAPNISPYDRQLLLVTYNSVDNPPAELPRPRPEFLCARDVTPLTPLAGQL